MLSREKRRCIKIYKCPICKRSFLAGLQLAFYKGYKTSVSLEPFLDKDPIPLIIKVAPYITDTIWVGKLNYMKTYFNAPENVKKVIENLRKLPEEVRSKIRLKDSIRGVEM